MGLFGGPHYDKHDGSHSLSCMVTASNLPDEPGWDYGRFHLLGIGVYVVLEPFTAIYFSGRLYHGGTAPLSPEGVDPPPWAYRMVIIGYPPRQIILGKARHAFAALPFSNQTLYISPEMTGISSYTEQDTPVIHEANIVNDGPATMTPLSYIQFIARSLLLFALCILRQVLSKWEPKIDTEMFLKSITITVDGHVYRGDEWQFGPTGDPHHPKTDQHRTIEDAVVRTLYEHTAQAIPSAPATLVSADISNQIPLRGRPNIIRKVKSNSQAQLQKGYYYYYYYYYHSILKKQFTGGIKNKGQIDIQTKKRLRKTMIH